MTAFELCRRNQGLELAPVLRIVKYLGLDSGQLDDRDIDRIKGLHSEFRHDPELVVGRQAIAERTGLEPGRIEQLLRTRRRELPFLGTPERPMVPAVGLEMLRAADRGVDRLPASGDFHRPADAPADTPADASADAASSAPAPARTAPEIHARIGRLEKELESALEQVRSLSRTLSNISLQATRRGNGAPLEPTRRHRRSGGGRPDTIVEACRTVLAESTGPMKVSDITERVVSSGVEIRAKNPNVTVSSILSSYEVFQRVRRGYYTLVEGCLSD